MKPIVAVIQARMGSHRLPGKILSDLHGQPVLAHVIERASAIKNVDKVVVATTTSPEDNPVIQVTKKYGGEVFRGSEVDVLDRVYQAAITYSASTIVRLTADCPLLDPEISSKVLDLFLEGNFDYVCNNHPATFPDGLDTEVTSLKILRKAWENARAKSDREHVTSYIWSNPKLFKIGTVTNIDDLSQMRWTLDQIEDLNFLNKLMSFFKEDNSIVLFDDFLKILRAHPEIETINNEIERDEGYFKSLQTD